MLNYLKYLHLDTSKKPRIDKEDDTENNETHNLQLANIETKKNHTANKGVDTGDDFYKVIPPYVSLMYSEDFDRNEKMVQVWTRMFNENLPPSPPSSSSSSSSSSKGSSESFTTKNIRRGFRLAEFAYNASVVGFNLAGSSIGTAIDISDYLFNNQQNETSEPSPSQPSGSEGSLDPSQPSGSEGGTPPSPPQTVNSSPPQTINSSTSPQTINSSSSRQTPTSLPAPTSPQSTPASSAKTTPRKKSK